ncbi:MAG: translation initiation factor eIF-2B [candidate division KSB1 bacterium]|nr:translation initiation factor eIF-2B [candidate division KSB1 bacterium]
MAKALRMLEKIRRDQVSGASVLANEAASCLLAFLEERKGAPPERIREGLVELGCALVTALPGNGPTFNLVNSLLLRMEGAEESDQLARIARGHITAWLQASQVALREIAATVGALIRDGDTVFTHSYSSSVFAGLKQAKAADRRFRTIVTESRPLLEGRTMARELASLGLPVTLVVDAAAPTLVAESDLVLFGAVMVTEDYIVNKVGTYALALAARHEQIPVYAVSELSKCLPRTLTRGFPTERQPDEVWARAPRTVDVRNFQFEAVPHDLFTGVATEQGVLTTADLRTYIAEELASAGVASVLASGGPGAWP